MKESTQGAYSWYIIERSGIESPSRGLMRPHCETVPSPYKRRGFLVTFLLKGVSYERSKIREHCGEGRKDE